MLLRRPLLAFLGLVLLVQPSRATWSIVCVNTRTREVAVASATCLQNFNLRIGVPVIYVGEGAAAAQSFVDQTGDNRRLIYGSFRDTEETPLQILGRLADRDAGHQTRQYGIVNFAGDPVSFTGSQDGLAATGVTGQVGDYLYAIQGNVLTGDEVVFAAEAAFRGAKGDMGQKLMAGMEAARALGGDGRCSCSERRPTSCGVPPPSFEKSAHVGVVVIARVGDENGGCNAARGCAQGSYYLNLNVIDGAGDPDPVYTLRSRYDKWRINRMGRPDGILSRLGGVKALPADGVTERTITVELRDLDERRLSRGGTLIEVATVDGLPSLAEVGPVVDLGNGRYTFTLRAGTLAGLDRFVIRATDVLPSDPSNVVKATLYPHLEIATLDRALYAGEDSVSAAAGARVPFVVNRRDKPGVPYLLVACLVPSGGPLRSALLSLPASPFFPSAPLQLDERGRSESLLEVRPGLLEPLIGARIECTGFLLDGAPLERTESAGFDVLP